MLSYREDATLQPQPHLAFPLPGCPDPHAVRPGSQLLPRCEAGACDSRSLTVSSLVSLLVPGRWEVGRGLRKDSLCKVGELRVGWAEDARLGFIFFLTLINFLLKFKIHVEKHTFSEFSSMDFLKVTDPDQQYPDQHTGD